MHLEEKAAEIVDLFARLGGGCWSTLSTPPRYGPDKCALSLSIHGCKSPRILTPDVERVLVPYAGNDVTAA